MLRWDFNHLSSTATAQLICARRHPTAQFIEEVQEEYDMGGLLGRLGWQECDNVFAVRRRIIAHRVSDTCILFSNQMRGLSATNESPRAL